MTRSFREERLANGLEITFADESNRYFGDYHRVCVVATIRCVLQDLPVAGPEEEALRHRAREVIGDHLMIVKRFERMGVPSASVIEVRQSLVDDFLSNVSPYLSRPDYPLILIKAELSKRPGQKFHV